MTASVKPWPALWSLIIGFFMILIDTTIVSVANPSILRGLHTDIDSVLWVTSAYLLAFSIPLLITGRLGDRFGPKRLYLGGLVLFTLASAACGLSGTVGMLIAARVVQGVGGALMSPQTMAVITRIFPPEKRGAAMGLWGASAGVATLVGPLAGGLLVDGLGWQWIFFVNVPIGVAAFVLAARNVPALPTSPNRVDLLGVALSAVGLFLIVFGVQEGSTHDWDGGIWAMIAAGVVVLVLFVLEQRFTKREPLVPLRLFRDRNFSLSNIAISAIGFSITSFTLPLIFYFQLVRGMTPTQSALLLTPTAVFNICLAPFVGRLVDRVHPRVVALPGLILFSASIWLYALLLSPTTPTGLLLVPSAVLGVANAFMWSPISTTATRGLPSGDAGAGSGVYNTTRQVGSVLGSASIATLITARVAANLPMGASKTGDFSLSGTLPPFLHAGFTTAMAQSLELPAGIAVIAAVAVALFVRPRAASGARDAPPQRQFREAHAPAVPAAPQAG